MTEGPLLIPVVTFKRVFQTTPVAEVVTLPELVAALRRFEMKTETMAAIERERGRIRQAEERLLAGETPRGKFMGKLVKAAEDARKKGLDEDEAIRSRAKAMDEDAKRSAKRDLRIWSPAVYRPGADERGADNVTHVSCLVLDYDDGTPIAEASDTWSAWFHCVHTTWSHRDDFPKFRVVMPLAHPVPAEDWSKVWSWAESHAHFSIDPSMKSPAANYALPAVPDLGHPREAFSRPGAILSPMDEGVLTRKVVLDLAPHAPLDGTPSVMRGLDPEKEYVDQDDPDALLEDGWGPDELPPSMAPTPAPFPPPRASAEELPPSMLPEHAGQPTEPVGAPNERPSASRHTWEESTAPETEGPHALADRQAALVERLAGLVERLERPNTIVDDLERLRDLHHDGWLTDAELAAAKEQLLAGTAGEGELRRLGKGRHRRTLCVDFDGVLHSYLSGWRGATEVLDPPVDGAIAWLTRAAEQFDLAVFSARSGLPGGIEAMRAWLRRHGLEERVLERIRFPRAKPPAELYLDDRAVRFEGTFPSLEELGGLAPWTEALRPKKKRRR